MKIRYVEENCNGYGICIDEAPEIFSFAEDGSLVIANHEPPPELQQKVRDACMLCPTQSIQIEE